MSEKLLKYNSDIIWSIPCAYRYETIAGTIYQIVKRLEPENEIKLSVYGAPPCVWSGDIIPDNYARISQEMFDIVNEYYEEINAKIKEIVAHEQVLREEIDKIIADIEGGDNE